MRAVMGNRDHSPIKAEERARVFRCKEKGATQFTLLGQFPHCVGFCLRRDLPT